MSDNNELMQSLSLDLLEEDSLSFDDLMVTKPDEKQVQSQQGTTNTDNNNSGEQAKPVESVAGEEGKDKAPGTQSAKDGTSSPGGDMSQIYSSLANHLHSSGVLSNLDKEKPIKNFSDLQEAIKAEIKGGLDEVTRAYKEAMEAGVPQSSFVQYERTMQQLNSITDEDLSSENNSVLRSRIIAQDFINRGLDKEEAERYAKRSLDLGEDVQDATNALKRIKDFTVSNFESQKKAIQDEQDNVNKSIKEFIDKKSEFINGIKLDENEKEKLYKQITTPVARDKEGNPLSKYGKALKDDPSATRATVEYLFMITDGFKDFSKLTNTIESSKTKELDDLLRNNSSSFTQGNNNPKFTDTNTSFLVDDLELDI